MTVLVKICGITRPEDARAAVDAGADWIGINFWPGSKRCVTRQQAQKIVAAIAGDARVVGVFVNADLGQVSELRDACQLNLIQFHGHEKNDTLASFAGVCIKAVSVADEQDLVALTSFLAADYFLLDTPTPQYGGSGMTFDWRLAKKAVSGEKKILLAGGLTPENVDRAVSEVCPFGVDVASGVESAPGIKDAEKMKRFVAMAKGAA